MKLKLERITKPYLELDISTKEFSKRVNLSSTRVCQIIIKDLKRVYYGLFGDSVLINLTMHEVKKDRKIWLDRVNEYLKKKAEFPLFNSFFNLPIE